MAVVGDGGKERRRHGDDRQLGRRRGRIGGRGRMAASLVDSVGAEMQHGEAELRAVLASSGVAGVHGTVRHGGGGRKRELGLRERESRGN